MKGNAKLLVWQNRDMKTEANERNDVYLEEEIGDHEKKNSSKK